MNQKHKPGVLEVIAMGTRDFSKIRHTPRGPGKVAVQMRCKSLAPFLPKEDVRWSPLGWVSVRHAKRMLRAMNREDPIFEFRLKP